MKILKWIDDCIEGERKDLTNSLNFVLKEFKKGNTENERVSNHLLNIKKCEDEMALLSLIKSMIEEELIEKSGEKKK